MENYKQYQNKELRTNNRYEMAYMRVQNIKGFYIHLLVFVIVNSGILVVRSEYFITDSVNFWNWQTLNTTVFWGIGLVVHGISAFGRNIFLGKGWKEEKIQKFMDKEKQNKETRE
jgi:hypothetical protein